LALVTTQLTNNTGDNRGSQINASGQVVWTGVREILFPKPIYHYALLTLDESREK
jgi:hypothetical protein